MSQSFEVPNPSGAGLLSEWEGMTEPLVGPLTASPVITRCPSNPIVKASDVPYKSDLVMNAGVCKFQGKYVMLFRNDIRVGENEVSEGVSMGLAFSDDGISWTVDPKPRFDIADDEILNAYDSRLMELDGRCCVTFAADTKHGTRGGIAMTDDFDKFDIISLSAPDNRNFAMFPEKINGMYVRLERPFPVYGRPGFPERFDIWMSDSPDLNHWGNTDLLLGVEDVPFANLKIGPGAPLVRTKQGWLCLYHTADFDPSRGKNGYERFWKKRYTAAVMLLDLDDPRKILGVADAPLIAPEAPYEISGGYRNNVVFPTGLILEDSGELKIYYGAADTTMCLATADVDAVVGLCKQP